MSTSLEDPITTNDLVAAMQKASPAVRSAALSELVRLHQNRSNQAAAPFFVRNDVGLVTAIVLPCPRPFDPVASQNDPHREDRLHKELEDLVRREGPLIRLD